MTNHCCRLLTRNSALALWQAHYVESLLLALPDAPAVKIVSMTTEGDQNLTDRLAKVGGKGLFIGSLEQALQAQQGDCAVHSYKDVPMTLDDGYTISAVLSRDTVADAFVSNNHVSLDALPRGAKVGTSSLRRMSQLLCYRPDLQIVPMRGNLNTRLAKLDSGVCDALILACAGLERLGLQERIAQVITLDIMLPAVAQGALAIETLAYYSNVDILLPLVCKHTTIATQAERAFARALAADCSAPVAAHATVVGEQVTLTARIIAHDGSRLLHKSMTGSVGEAEAIGAQVAHALLADGGEQLLVAAKTYIDSL